MTAADVMRSTLMTVPATRSVYSLAQWYNNLTNNAHVTYVVDDSRRLLGIVTIYDLITLLARNSMSDEGRGEINRACIDRGLERIKETRVESVMEKNCIWVHPEDNISTALDIIVRRRFTAVPVLDDNRVLVGEVSRQILLSVLGPAVFDSVNGFVPTSTFSRLSAQEQADLPA